MNDGIALGLSRSQPYQARVLEQVGWQQRFICPAEGPGPWSFCSGEEANILNANPAYELRPVFAPIVETGT